jgi:hypothetical protein
MAAPQNQRPRVALVVGISQYLQADQIAALGYASWDARTFARSLADAEIGGFPRNQVLLLTDRKARRDRIVRGLSKWLPAQAKGAELAVFYFAGHGMVFSIGAKEEGFLLPFDADPDDVVTRGIAMSDVAHWIDGIGAEAVVVILDCCHAGKVLLREGATLRSLPRDLGIRPAVLQTISGKGRFLIASCDEGQQSLESPELKHGLFTYHLLEGMGGAADKDADGKVGVAELFHYVSAAVARDARAKYGRDQKPWASSVWADDVYISRPTKREDQSEARPLERLWHEQGGVAALHEIERQAAGADEARLVALLRFLKGRTDPAAVPFLSAIWRTRLRPCATAPPRPYGRFPGTRPP